MIRDCFLSDHPVYVINTELCNAPVVFYYVIGP